MPYGRRRQFPIASLATALLCALLAAPSAAVTVSDGLSTITVSDTHGDLQQFATGGPDHLFQAHYYYRVNGMTSEIALTGPTSSSVTSVSGAGSSVTVLGSTPEFDYTIDFALNSGDLITDFTATNTLGVDLTLTLFAYYDFDVDGSFGGDTITWDGTRMTQTDTSSVVIVPALTPDAVEASVFSNIRDQLRDGGIDNLTDGAGLPFGPGDGTFAFEWNLFLPTGGTVGVPVAVPEPSPFALVASGLFGLLWAGRRRA